MAEVLRSRCVVLLTGVSCVYSWRWAYRCPKYVELFIIINKLLHQVGISRQLRLVTGLWILRRQKYTNAGCHYSGRPSIHSPQNTSAVQLAVSQPICVAAVMCRSAHWRPFLPLVPSGNNCRSEHIHIMLLSDLVVTTEQHQGTFMGLMLAKSFILNSCHLSLSWV